MTPCPNCTPEVRRLRAAVEVAEAGAEAAAANFRRRIRLLEAQLAVLRVSKRTRARRTPVGVR